MGLRKKLHTCYLLSRRCIRMRSTLVLIVILVMVLALASPVFAHMRLIGGGPGMTGSPPLPAAAQGQGLVPGGPGGIYLQSPSHAKGLNTACEALRGNPSAQDMWGPPNPATCNHGGPPPAP